MCRGPVPGELVGVASLPYSQVYLEVSVIALAKVPLTYTLIDEVVPSGIENRTTTVLVLARVVQDTDWPVPFSVTALRPDASPARSPMVRFGPTTWAPPATVPSSASYMS